MAREWDEGRGAREDQRDRRRSGANPDDFENDRRREGHGDDRPRHADREGNPMRGTHADDRGGDFGYERQSGDHRGRGGFAPRAAMDPGYHEDFGDQEFGTHNRGRKTFGGDLGRTDHDRGYGENYGRGSDRRARHEFEQRGGYSGGSGMGPGHFGRGQTGEGERGYRGGAERGERSFWDRASDEVSSWFGDDDAERRRDRDLHRGRGPKGYKRSDARIAEDVNDRLSDDPYVDASEIEVRIAEGEVTLTGSVDSRASKRRAEDVVESVSGVTHCQNNLRVRQTGKAELGNTTPATGTASPTAPSTGADRSRH